MTHSFIHAEIYGDGEYNARLRFEPDRTAVFNKEELGHIISRLQEIYREIERIERKS